MFCDRGQCLISSEKVMPELSKDLKEFLKQYPSIEVIDERLKVKCSWSGHEMPCRQDAVASYVKGRKYKRLLEEHAFDYEKYKQHLEPSKKKHREHQLFCRLTWRHLNKQPHHIQRHIQGYRFQKALAKWEECQKTGEKFVPRQRGGSVKGNVVAEESDKSAQGSDGIPDILASDDEDIESEDDLSDLYPESDDVDSDVVHESEGKENDENNGDSDFDFKDIEQSDLQCNESDSQNKNSSKKRKLKVQEKQIPRRRKYKKKKPIK